MNEPVWERMLTMPQFWMAGCFFVLTVWAIWYSRRRDRWQGRTLEPRQVLEMIAVGEDPLLVDTRKSHARARTRETAKGALVLPLERIPAVLGGKVRHRLYTQLRSAEIVVLEDGRDRAAMAGRMLKDYGLLNVALMRGGLSAWRKAGGETEALPPEEDES